MMNAKQLSLNATLLALLIILGMMPPIAVGLPVPIVLQNFGIFLIAGLLNTRSATLVIATFLTLTALGLPLLSGMRGGLPVMIGPTGGYLLGWLLTPISVAAVQRLLATKTVPSLWALLLGGMFVTDLAGTIWLTIFYHTPFTVALLSNLVYIPGDLIKIVACSVVLTAVNRAVSFK
ncbi:biotin transporter BioY [Secundilactobacillus kimchicus]|uniref:biotin transporter BioY n=2 Tax=Secundilactobacillus kimchicus TaxID=528209 RepID=UPI0024A8381E|nr:biotin transporter BioY [Secundilactobacillus kimchicus]